jgi:4-hydroxy-3-polyprenylbenzoate decarboxylase
MKANPGNLRPERSIVVGVTGASGAVYAQRLVRYLLENDFDLLLSISKAGQLVLKEELEPAADPWGTASRERLHVYPEKDFGAPFCSGSFRFRGMVVIPASMGTVGSIAHGVSVNNIHRGADVALKEKLPLVLVPRETPLSVIHLENLLSLARAGAVVLPPSPAFYQKPESIADQVDFIVSRVLDALSIPNRLYRRWNEND